MLATIIILPKITEGMVAFFIAVFVFGLFLRAMLDTREKTATEIRNERKRHIEDFE